MASCEVYELRIHGVSGSPPETVLDVPAAGLVAGDRKAGFYRRRDADGRTAGPEHGRLVEAYHWGGLTSGGRLRALWLLLAPFALVNAAFFTAAVPLGVDPADFRVPAGKGADLRRVRAGGASWRAVRRVTEASLRLVALSLTVLAVAGTAVVAMDLVGWQMAAREPGDRPGWLGFLDRAWLRDQPRPFLLLGLVPLALIALFWFLANNTWAHLEAVPVPRAAGVASTPLEDRLMWNGRGPVRRLRAVHITTAITVLAGFVLLPLWFTAGAGARSVASVWRGPQGPAVVVLTSLMLVLLAACPWLAALPSMSDRRTPGKDHDDWRDVDAFTFLPWTAVAVLGAVAVTTGLGPAWDAARAAESGAAGALPGLAGALQVLFLLQTVLVLVIAAGAGLLRWVAMRHAYPQITGAGDPDKPAPVVTRPAWGGLAPAALTLLACALSAGWSAGLAVTVARLLGTPQVAADPAGTSEVVLPSSYSWTAAAAFCALVALVVPAVFVVAGTMSGRDPVTAEVRSWYGEDAPGADPAVRERRVARIATAWHRADLVRIVQRAVGAWTVMIAVIVVGAVAGHALDPEAVFAHVPWMVAAGTLVLAALAGVMITLGRRTYREHEVRRVVGVLWDLCTFWVRAAHPLAPPCYMERTLPDLLERLGNGPLSNSRHIVLSGHSQGSVIAAALVMQMEVARGGNVSLITYGCPLRRLYAPFFPAYFGEGALGRLGQFLRRPGWTGETGFADDREERETWRWRNLYRPTDPIGGPVFADHRGQPVAEADVDWWLPDPVFDPPPGDRCAPRIYGHSGYPADAAYARAVETLLGQPTLTFIEGITVRIR
ncbi:hypothetical protein [Actinoplanes sp. NPDC020271]|uniref:hypothetical protein n=1 Tax=Actinoplanes sp. NPDC020271 TaxID=3363896 RepID=UPI00379E2D74